MKRAIGLLLAAVVLVCVPISAPALAAFDDSTLTWDGSAISLRELAQELGYDMVESDGNYKPMYSFFAEQLWSKGLMLGSDGVFHLDKPLTRVEGLIMTLRLLGKEQEAVAAALPCTFTDVPDWAKHQVAYAAQSGITSGYSATTFGANDPMTANQYLTFVLRAMGYSDSNGDFVWSSAADKAFALGLIGESCRAQYMRSNLFLRDNVAVISNNALFAVPSKDGSLLGNSIVGQRPDGDVPYATAAEKALAEAPPPPKPPEEPPVLAVMYDAFPVPQYESVDASAVCKTVKDEADRLFLAYTDSGYHAAEFEKLLRASGFSSRGTVNFEPKTVTTVTGGLVYVGTEAWVCDYFSSGDLHVVFGRVGNAFIVRIYEGTVDMFSANGIRSFYYLITS